MEVRDSVKYQAKLQAPEAGSQQTKAGVQLDGRNRAGVEGFGHRLGSGMD